MKHVLVICVIATIGCKQKAANDTGMDRVEDKDKVGRGRDDGSDAGVPLGLGSGSGPGSKGGSGIQLLLDGEIELAAGSIDKDIVRKVVKDNVTKLQYCYEKTLLASPGIEGKVVATFTIASDGSVSDVKAAGVHPDVEACVAEAVKAFKFPPSGAKVEVSYPFTFKPA